MNRKYEQHDYKLWTTWRIIEHCIVIHNRFKHWVSVKRKWLYASLKESLNTSQKLQYTDFCSLSTMHIWWKWQWHDHNETRKIPFFQKRRHTLPNNSWFKEDETVIWDVKLNENENITYETLWEKNASP